MRAHLRSHGVPVSSRSRCRRVAHTLVTAALPSVRGLASGSGSETRGHPAVAVTSPREPHVAAADGIPARLRSLLVSALCSCVLVISQTGPALSADSVTIRFPASRDPEIRSAQEVLVQAWGYVREYYFDPTFNHQDWQRKLQDALASTFKAASRDEALRAVEGLLASLDDPFTRVLLPGAASEAFEAQTQAKIISTGLVSGRLGAADGPLQVVYVVPGSPAAAAGLREGDIIVAVNGRPVVATEDPSLLQEQLRQGKEVQLKVMRTDPGPPAIASTSAAVPSGGGRGSAAAAGRVARRAAIRAAAIASGGGATPAEPAAESITDCTAGPSLALSGPSGPSGSIRELELDSSGDGSEGRERPAPLSGAHRALAGPPSTTYPLNSRFTDVRLQPAPVEYVPVQYAVLAREGPGGDGGRKQTLGQATDRGGGATGSMASDEPTAAPPPPSPARVGYIRVVAFTEHVAAEVEAAIWALKAAGCGSWLLDVRGNPGGIVREGLAVAELLLRPGEVFAVVRDRGGQEQVERLSDQARALVDGQPVAVLVDRHSASTSELLAGALHDDVGALLVGERTYGKGRTQRVVQLSAGVTLLVSTDTYVTPARRVVDRVGLAPDVACRPGPPPSPVARPVAVSPPSEAMGDAVVRDAAPGSGVAVNAGDTGSDVSGGSSVASGALEAEQVDGLLRDPCVRSAVMKLSRGSVLRGTRS